MRACALPGGRHPGSGCLSASRRLTSGGLVQSASGIKDLASFEENAGKSNLQVALLLVGLWLLPCAPLEAVPWSLPPALVGGVLGAQPTCSQPRARPLAPPSAVMSLWSRFFWLPCPSVMWLTLGTPGGTLTHICFLIPVHPSMSPDRRCCHLYGVARP